MNECGDRAAHSKPAIQKKQVWSNAVAAAMFLFRTPMQYFLFLQRQKSIMNRRHTTIMPSGCQLDYSPPAISRTLQNNKEGGCSSPPLLVALTNSS